MRHLALVVTLAALACSNNAPAGPTPCTSGADCPGSFCGDPQRGLLLGRGDERVPADAVGQCCANSNIALAAGSRGGIYGCDNLCGGTGENDGNPKYGCFKKLGDAFNAKLHECGQPCAVDDECVRGAFCDPRGDGGICVPRTCAECAEIGADCSYDLTKCSDDVRMVTSQGTTLEVVCKVRQCAVPCSTAADCPSSACLSTSAGKLCIPSDCSACFSSQKRCDLDVYTCAFYGCSGCVPSCAGRNCGSDGCSGTCGSCPNVTDVCHSGSCVACPQAGMPCESGSSWPCRSYTISCESGTSQCVASGLKVGAVCDVNGLPGHCTSTGSCRSDTTTGGTGGGSAGSGGSGGSGGGSSSSTCDATGCIQLLEVVDTPFFDYMCSTAGAHSYYAKYRNNCSSAAYCAFCASGGVDCTLGDVGAGNQFWEWADGNKLHCTPPNSGLFVNCVPASNSTCRSLLVQRYLYK